MLPEKRRQVVSSPGAAVEDRRRAEGIELSVCDVLECVDERSEDARGLCTFTGEHHLSGVGDVFAATPHQHIDITLLGGVEAMTFGALKSVEAPVGVRGGDRCSAIGAQDLRRLPHNNLRQAPSVAHRLQESMALLCQVSDAKQCRRRQCHDGVVTVSSRCRHGAPNGTLNLMESRHLSEVSVTPDLQHSSVLYAR